MTNDTQHAEAPPPQAEKPPRIRTTELTRATTDNMIAGVAEGLARRTGIWSGWVRAAFVLFAFAGGLGVAAYLALWVLVRADNEPDSIAQRFFARTTSKGSWLGVAFIFVAVLILLDNVRFLSGGIIWAVGLLAIGYLLYTGDLPRLISEPVDRPEADAKEGVQQITTTTTDVPAIEVIEEVRGDGGNAVAPPPPPPAPTAPPPFVPAPKPKEKSILGRVTLGVMAIALGILAAFDTGTSLVDPAPRHYLALAVTVLGIGLLVGTFAGRARWLILVGVLALPFLFASPGLEYEFTESSGGTSYITPTSFDDLDGSIFDQSIGELVVDLRDLPWDDQNLSIRTDMGIGRTTVLLPEDVTLTGAGTVSIGQVSFDNRYSAGLDAGLGFEGDGGAPSLDLSSHVGIGSLNIRRLPAEN